MKKLHFLICYDVSDEKRLRKVAKLLEKIAIRIQYSVFLYSHTSKNDLMQTVLKLEEIINIEEDDIRIYKVNITKSLHLKSAIDLKYPNIIR